MRVIAANSNGDSDPSATAAGTPQSQPGRARQFFENEVIKIFESSSPWLRATWDYLTAQTVPVTWSVVRGGTEVQCTHPTESKLQECDAFRVLIARSNPNLIYGITHELAHVYMLANSVTSSSVPPRLAPRYFQALTSGGALGGPSCDPIEIFADAVVILTLGDQFRNSFAYWSSCSLTTDTVTEQALTVVKSALAGQMPSWLADTYNDSDGNPDLARVWADLKAIAATVAVGNGEANEHIRDHAIFAGVTDSSEAAPPITVVPFVSNLNIPWDLAFTPDGTMLFTERSGRLSSRLTDGTVQSVTADFSDLIVRAEAGLMAIVVDPSFSSNRRFYSCQAHTGLVPEVQVIAWTINETYTVARRVADPLVGGIPSADFHNGCRLRFGPDGYLWIATGDGSTGTAPQDLESLGGKVLRVDASTGAAAPDNPFASLVYTYGHRNVQGLALRPGTNNMWSVEHGPSLNDEINLLIAGGNYGWNPVPGNDSGSYYQGVPMTDLDEFPNAVEAKWSSGKPTLAPSGGVFLTGDYWGEWNGRLAVATLKNKSLRIFEFSSAGTLVSHVVASELTGVYGRLRTPILGPDGALYVTTSNAGGADHILRVVPSLQPEFSVFRETQSAAENSSTSAVVATITATDPEGEALTYTLGGTDADAFNIADDAVGEVRALAPLDYEEKSSYQLTVTATDPWGLSDHIALTLQVIDADDPPSITGLATPSVEEEGAVLVGTYRATDPENATITWQPLGGSDSDKFEFSSSTGRLVFKAAPNYENAGDIGRTNMYDVTLSAAADGQTTPFDVAVSVTNKEEFGSLGFSSPQPQADADYTATLSDPDGVVSTTWTWERSTSRNGPWTSVSGASDSTETSVYQPDADDVGYYLRVTASFTDGHGPDKSLLARSANSVIADPANNTAPYFATLTTTRDVAENASANATVGAAVTATDDDPRDVLTYTLSGSSRFTIDSARGRIRVASGAMLDHERGPSHTVSVTASDSSNATASISVTISVTNVNEPPEADDIVATTNEDTAVTLNVLADSSDPENDVLTVSLGSGPRNGSATVDPDTQEITYTPKSDYHGSDTVTYILTDPGRLTDSGEIALTIHPINDAPLFSRGPLKRQVARSAQAGDDVGSPVTATDIDGDSPTYGLRGPDASSFEIDDETGQITVGAGVIFDPLVQSEYSVKVEARDEDFARAEVAVTITVVERVQPPPTGGGGGGGGGGGPPPVPIPSDKDFDWNVTRDIEALDRDNDLPTDMWSDGTTLWVLENSASGADRVFAYDLQTGERRQDAELELESRNRFSHGLWSDDETVWVADSGQDKLFAYELASSERLAERDIELAERNRDPRGIWADGETLYVLDSVKDALFVYDFETGELVAEYPLDKLNKSPRGIWSDGVTIWVSDDGAKRLFAYEFEDTAMTRNEDLEFTFRALRKAGNGNARGIWSDGDVMYVADEQDDKVYSYNIPDATIAQLASLSLSDIDIEEFSPNRFEYTATAVQEVSLTTVTVEASQEAATVAIEPVDADGDLENGNQVNLGAETTITIAVTSEDGSRTTTYRVQISKPTCLEGLSEARLSQVSFVGGSVSDLEACARSANVNALYHLRDGTWTALFLFPDLPEFLSQPFRNRFLQGLVPGEPLIAHRQMAVLVPRGRPNSN